MFELLKLSVPTPAEISAEGEEEATFLTPGGNADSGVNILPLILFAFELQWFGFVLD